MKTKLRIITKTLFTTFFFIAASSPCFADLSLQAINSPNELPEGLSITSKTSNGMIEFDVSIDAEAIANNESYKGRIRASAFLKIVASREQIASVKLDGETKGKKTYYQFRLSPSATKSSDLQLGVSLYEKDGLATLGGGVSMQVHLAGFEPKADVQARIKSEQRVWKLGDDPTLHIEIQNTGTNELETSGLASLALEVDGKLYTPMTWMQLGLIAVLPFGPGKAHSFDVHVSSFSAKENSSEPLTLSLGRHTLRAVLLNNSKGRGLTTSLVDYEAMVLAFSDSVELDIQAAK